MNQLPDEPVNRRVGLLRVLRMFRPLLGRVPLGHLWYLLRRMRNEQPHETAGLTRINTFFPPWPSRAFERFCEAVAHRRRVPFSTYLAVTSRCPYRCGHCSLADRPGGEMTTRQVLDLIAQVKALGTCTLGLTGGEPLLRDDLEELVRSAGPEMATVIFTTGHGLDDRRAAGLARAGVTCVTVGIESADPAVQARVRGEMVASGVEQPPPKRPSGSSLGVAPSEDSVEYAIEASGLESEIRNPQSAISRPQSAIECPQSAISEGSWGQAWRAVEACARAGVYTAISTIATREKLHSGELERMHELGRRWGVGEFRVLAPVATGGWAGACDAMLTADEMRALADFHVRTNRRRRLPAVACFAYLESAELFGCGAGYHHLFIDAAGEVCPCDLTPLSMGNALAGSVAEVWAEMASLFPRPRRTCLMRELAGRVQPPLPVPAERARALCRGCTPPADLPEGYRRLL